MATVSSSSSSSSSLTLDAWWWRSQPRAHWLEMHRASTQTLVKDCLPRWLRELGPRWTWEDEQGNTHRLYLGGKDGTRVYPGPTVRFDEVRAEPWTSWADMRDTQWTWGQAWHMDVSWEVELGENADAATKRLPTSHTWEDIPVCHIPLYLEEEGAFLLRGQLHACVLHTEEAVHVIQPHDHGVYMLSPRIDQDHLRPVQRVSVHWNEDEALCVSVDEEIQAPLFLVLRALGMTNDQEMVEWCCGGGGEDLADRFRASVYAAPPLDAWDALQAVAATGVVPDELFPSLFAPQEWMDKACLLCHMASLVARERHQRRQWRHLPIHVWIEPWLRAPLRQWQDHIRNECLDATREVPRLFAQYESVLDRAWIDLLSSKLPVHSPDRPWAMMESNRRVWLPSAAVPTPFGYVDPVDYTLCMGTRVTQQHSPDPALLPWILEESKCVPLADCTPDQVRAWAKLFVNGRWHGMVDDAVYFWKWFKLHRRNGHHPVTWDTSIEFRFADKELHVCTDAGRLVRPLCTVLAGQASYRRKEVRAMLESEETDPWDRLVHGLLPREIAAKDSPRTPQHQQQWKRAQATIEYIDEREMQNLVVASREEDIGPSSTHVEWHPWLVGLGHLAHTIIPLVHHLSTRAWQHTHHHVRQWTCVQEMCQCPLVQPRMPAPRPWSGTNALVALVRIPGAGPIAVNAAAMDRGLFPPGAWIATRHGCSTLADAVRVHPADLPYSTDPEFYMADLYIDPALWTDDEAGHLWECVYGWEAVHRGGCVTVQGPTSLSSHAASVMNGQRGDPTESLVTHGLVFWFVSQRESTHQNHPSLEEWTTAVAARGLSTTAASRPWIDAQVAHLQLQGLSMQCIQEDELPPPHLSAPSSADIDALLAHIQAVQTQHTAAATTDSEEPSGLPETLLIETDQVMNQATQPIVLPPTITSTTPTPSTTTSMISTPIPPTPIPTTTMTRESSSSSMETALETVPMIKAVNTTPVQPTAEEEEGGESLKTIEI